MKADWRTLSLCFILCGCTTVGIPDKESMENIDFGPPEKLRICIYKDVDISDQQADDIIATLQQEFSHFGLAIEVPWVKQWTRPAFSSDEILNNFASCPLEAPCDRLLALVGRNFGDFLWGIIMPEIHGYVEVVSMTKGLAVAEIGSFNQILGMSSATRTAIHETYHLLGCDHDLDAKSCYQKIAFVKKIARKSRLGGSDFFPSVTLDQRVLRSRLDVDKKLKPFLNHTHSCITISRKN
jgi:hypothetical protein